MLRRLSLLVILVTIVPAISPAEAKQPASGKKYALLFGVNKYHNRKLAGLLAAVVALPALADEASEKRKKAAVANLAKGEVSKAATVETESLIVCAALPEAKAKMLAESMQKAHALGRKVLQFDEKDDPWKGKLTVYYLPDSRAFKAFVRSVGQSRPDESYFFALRDENPYIVESGETGDPKATEADQFAEASARVVAALLVDKGGTGTAYPEWLKTGLGRAVAMRAAGTTSKRYVDYKAAARRTVLGGAGRPAGSVNDVWTGRGKDAELLGTSLMEYMAFGPGQPNFIKFVNGFRPGENAPTPGVTEALAAAMWKPETLEAAWKKWVQSGK